MQVEANREVEGPPQKKLVINNSVLIIKGAAISGFIKKFRNYGYCRYRINNFITSLIKLRNGLEHFYFANPIQMSICDRINFYLNLYFVRYTCSLKNLKPKFYKGKKQTCKRRRALK